MTPFCTYAALLPKPLLELVFLKLRVYVERVPPAANVGSDGRRTVGRTPLCKQGRCTQHQ